MLSAAEGQHLLDQVTGTLAGTLRPVQITGHFPVAQCLRTLPCQHHVTCHRGEDVVEVVRDPTSQLADGLHFLSLSQLLLQLLALLLGLASLGDVTQVTDEDFAFSPLSSYNFV